MNYKLIEMLVPIVIRLMELLLQREERKDDEESAGVQADRQLAQAVREKAPYGKSDDEIIEEVFG